MKFMHQTAGNIRWDETEMRYSSCTFHRIENRWHVKGITTTRITKATLNYMPHGKRQLGCPWEDGGQTRVHCLSDNDD